MAATDRPHAVITGASSGIGAAFAARLAGDGYDLTLIARRRGRLAELAARLAHAAPGTVSVHTADLTDPGGLRSAEDLIAADPQSVPSGQQRRIRRVRAIRRPGRTKVA